jgi:4-amino-4-deoxy-L-arabinose transferase-like glycosyltransferase
VPHRGTRLARLGADWRQATLPVVAFVFSLAVRTAWLFALMERDEGTFGYVGWRMALGDVLYVDVIDTKGPYLYALYGLSSLLLGNSIIPVRLFNNLLFALSMGALYWLCIWWWGRRAAGWAVLAYGLGMSIPVFEGHLAMSESLMVPFVIFAYLALEGWLRRPAGRHRLGLLALSGTGLAVATLIRPSGVFGLGPMLAMLAWDAISRAERTGFVWLRRALGLLARMGVVMAGMVPPAAPFAMYLVRHGLVQRVLEAWGPGTLRYMRFMPTSNVGMQALFLKEGGPLFFLAGLGAALLLVWLSTSREGLFRPSRPGVFVLLWAATYVYVATLPPVYGHYFAQAVPPLGALAGVALDTLTGIEYHRAWVWGARGALLMILAVLVGLSIFYQLIQYPDMTPPSDVATWRYDDSASYADQVRLAEWLRHDAATNQGETLVHGMSAGIYWMAGLKSPTRDTWSLSLIGSPHPVGVDDLLPMLARGQIRTVVLFRQYMSIQDPIKDYTLAAFDHTEIVGNAHIYKRNDLSP